MTLPADFVHEISLLMQFDLSSAMTGLKIHHDAAPETLAAAERLFSKGLLDRVDGGYLTPLGHEVAEHLQAARRMLG